MLNLKKLKVPVCSSFIFLILILPIGNILAADAVNTATDVVSGTVENLPFTFFMGPMGVPASFILSAFQTLDILPETKPIVDILNPVQYVYSGIITAANILIVTASTTIIAFGQTALDYTLKYFIDMNVTDNSVVVAGWGIVRNIANAVLVIGLVIIAINIILGREEDKAKKTLINFIIIALLINFTPVICGFIIDGSNIITKDFLTGGINPNYTSAIIKTFGEAGNKLDGQPTYLLLTSMALLIFSIIAFFIYILYALLFVARYVILFILVIASPIAFATKVFPQSKYIKKVFPSITYWDDWWESFVQWCVIGIPAGLSIYLSNMIMSQITFEAISFTGSSKDIVAALVSGLFAYLVPIIILIVGFLITISAGGQAGSFVGGLATGAFAASGGRVLGWGKEKIQGAGQWVEGGAKRAVAGAAIGAVEGYQKVQDEGLTAGNVLGGVPLKAAYYALRGAATQEGREKGMKKFTQFGEKMRVLPQGTYEAGQAKDVSEAEKNLENSSLDTLHRTANMAAATKAQSLQRSAAINVLNKKGEINDSELNALVANPEKAKTLGVKLKDVAKARPDYAARLIKPEPGKPPTTAASIIQEMNPKKAGETIHSPAYANTEVLSAIAASNPKILDGKMNKGHAKDIENIKKGYKAYFETILPTTNVDVDDIKGFVVSNQAAIKTKIGDLQAIAKNTTNQYTEEQKKQAELDHKALKNLANFARLGKI